MNVGDYVRTKNGRIIKVENYNEQPNNPLFETLNGKTQMKGTIIKSSPNVIDLIKVGDIIKKTYKTGLIEIIPINKIEDIENIRIDIKNNFKITIVTKEQFAQMEYKNAIIHP